MLPVLKLKPLVWQPHLPPVDLAEATQAQLDAMTVTPSAKAVSPYVRTLAHDPESYVARTELFNAILYADGALPRADRELAAFAASLVGGCRYCANVHARQHINLSGSSAAVAAICLGEFEALTPRDRAIAEFALALAAAPPAATGDQVDALRAAGLDDAEIIDLIHAVAIFSWANRLMHPLGRAEPQP